MNTYTISLNNNIFYQYGNADRIKFLRWIVKYNKIGKYNYDINKYIL